MFEKSYFKLKPPIIGIVHCCFFLQCRFHGNH
jgi:hypothetical protein